MGAALMPQVRANGITIGYDVHGDGGDWLVLVMGHAYARWAWNRQIEDLSKDFRVIAFDNRGIGETDAPPAPYTVEEMAADALGLLDALGVERAHVLGCSLGGCISLELALAHPERVDRLVLACTSLGGSSPKSHPLSERVVRIIRQAAKDPPDVRLRKGTENAFAEAFVAAHREVIDEVLRRRQVTAQTLEAWMAQASAYPAYDATDRAGGLHVESLVVTGTEDNVIEHRNSRVLADTLPDATLVEMPGAGHLFFIEEAPRFNALVRAFLRDGKRGVRP